MRKFRFVALFFCIALVPSISDAKTADPIRIGFYYLWHNADVTSEDSGLDTLDDFLKNTLVNISEWGGKELQFVFLKKIPPFPIPMMDLGEESRAILGISPDQFFAKLREQSDTTENLEKVDFLLVISPLPIFMFLSEEENPDGNGTRFIYISASGAAEDYGGRIALIRYIELDQIPMHMLHEIGHLLGLHHVAEEICETRPLLMCVGGAKTEIDEELKKRIREYSPKVL